MWIIKWFFPNNCKPKFKSSFAGMAKKIIPAFFCIMFINRAFCQDDSLENERLKNMVTLSEVVIHNHLDIAKFLRLIKDDTTFYKAFRTLHILGFTSLNDIRMKDKSGNIQASLQSKTIQHVTQGCRTM